MSYFETNVDDILYLGNYHPYWINKELGKKNPFFDKWSGYILDLKEQKESAISFFLKQLDSRIDRSVCIAVVPSHDPEKVTVSGIHQLAQRLVAQGRFDATSCLRRSKKIPKLSYGGERSISVHLQSIVVVNTPLIKGKIVWLLDDISTSGNSLKACRYLLSQAGAKQVKSVALGKTIRVIEDELTEEGYN